MKHIKKYTLFLFLSIFLATAVSSCSTVKKAAGRKHPRNKHKTEKSHKRKTETTVHHIPVNGNNKRGKKVVNEALEWIGTPYKYACAEKGKGTDCSGLVMSAYLEATGIKLPRNSAKQAEFCKKISEKEVRVGDLCFFATGKDPNRVSHVGIMIDDDTFIHASSSRGVETNKITSSYYSRTFLSFGRVPE